MELYKTVRSEAEATQIIEKSKFTAHVRPVESKEEADAFVAEIKNRYKDATHNVPAMVVGDKFQIQWASDDGEPQGTSGAPMVQMLVKEGITNVAVVVTRYFGGIKLGTGGLVRAYTSSAKLGLEAAGVCSVQEICSMKIKTDYSYLAKFQNMAVDKLNTEADGTKIEFVIDDIQYTDKVVLKVICMPEIHENVKELFMNITSGTAEIQAFDMILEKI
ncbi:MAG: YigZ family protein [Bacillota bacterium]|nr:YigZ family protein [Bacillota bacterium]